MRSIICCALFFIVVIHNVQALNIYRDGALNMGLKARGFSIEKVDEKAAPAQWFNQKIDHFDPMNNNTFKQLYYVNDTYWTGAVRGGPIFIFLGGEGPLSPAYVADRFVVSQYAARYGALIVAVEHRFYGQSLPAPDLSTNNLRLLTTVQALADFAQFRHFIATSYNATRSKWISFGGSYSGSLSAWFRLKYPHLIDGSIATSAPVLAQLNFPEYFEVVQNSLGPSCSARVAQATAQITDLLKTGAGRQKLQDLFVTCDPIVTDDDVSTFLSSTTDGICETVQYNNDNNGNSLTIPKICSMLEAGSDPLQAYVNFNNYYNSIERQNCTDTSYSKMIAEMRNVAPRSPVASARSWTWQTCTEYGYYQTGSAPLNKQPFSPAISLEWFLKQCKDIFGYPLTPNTVAINDIFGAKELVETRVVVPNGSIDPWHALGILGSTSPACDESDVVALYMTGTAHCADLYAPTPNDPTDLTATRNIEQTLIADWLHLEVC